MEVREVAYTAGSQAHRRQEPWGAVIEDHPWQTYRAQAQTGPLRVEAITTSDALDDLESEWHTLERRVGLELPFMTWEWTRGWWAHMREQRWCVRDRLAARAVRTACGELVAVAPLLITERPSFGPLRIRALQFCGPDPNITELRGMLCDPSYEPAVYDALLEHLARADGQWTWAHWSGIRAGSAAASALTTRGIRLSHETSAYALSLPLSWEELRSSRPPNVREALRKGYASLRNRGLAYRLDVIQSPAEIPAALDDFFRLHSARAHLTGTEYHRDVFATPFSRRFLADVCGRLAMRDAVRVFVFRVEERPVAARIGFVLGGSVYLYYSGWDPAYARYSVMTTALAEILKYAIAHGMRSAHLSFGRDQSKTRWRPDETTYLSGVQVSSAPQHQVMSRLFALARHSDRTALRNTIPSFLLRGSTRF